MPNFIERWLSLTRLRRPDKQSTDRRRVQERAIGEGKSYRSVELRTRGVACRDAKSLAGKRILIDEAPPLPLKGCTLRCTCYYKEHPDRRDSEPRRIVDVGMSGTFYAGPERRSGLDRRRRHRDAEHDGYYDYMRRRD